MKDPNEIKIGMIVRVIRDDGTDGMFIDSKNLERRRVGAVGIVRGWVPGHGGDVWFVLQDDGLMAYSFTELESA